MKVASDKDTENPQRFQRSLKAKHIPDQIHFDIVNYCPIKTENPNNESKVFIPK